MAIAALLAGNGTPESVMNNRRNFSPNNSKTRKNFFVSSDVIGAARRAP
jgi:hypothetical protein